MKRILTTAVALVLLCQFARGEAVEEKYPDGAIKAKFNTTDGKRDGAYAEFHPNGKPKIKAVYAEGQLNGAYTEYFENGAPKITAGYKKDKLHGRYVEQTEKGGLVRTGNYKDGVPDGVQVQYEKGRQTYAHTFKDGLLTAMKGPDGVQVPAFVRTPDQIRRRLAEIESSPAAGVPPPKVGKAPATPPQAKTKAGAVGGEGDDEAANRLAGLRRLRAYRYLAEIPYEDLVLDEEMNRHCEAGAKLCQKIGRLDHKPANPGLPEAEYKFAFVGTSSSNLFQGRTSLATSIDGYMDDSDPSNIDRVGHRRWCLNPQMLKTGFGRAGVFSAMWSFDNSRKAPFDYDFVAYPSRGLMPTGYFGDKHAWSVSLNPAKFAPPDAGSVKVQVFELDEQYRKSAEPLSLNHMGVQAPAYGKGPCLIFRPDGVSAKPGKSYWVEIDGLRDAKKAPLPVRYIVGFMDPKDYPAAGQTN